MGDLCDIARDSFSLVVKSFQIASNAKPITVTGQHHRSNLLILVTSDGDIQKFARHFRSNCIALVRTVETDQSNPTLYFKND